MEHECYIDGQKELILSKRDYVTDNDGSFKKGPPVV
jgi:hypothetical protein